MYNNELFLQKFAALENEWNNEIVPYYEKFLDYLRGCDPRSPIIYSYIGDCWTLYVHLHKTLAQKIYEELKAIEVELSPEQKEYYNQELFEMRNSILKDKQAFTRIVQERRKLLNNPIPMPILEEQMVTEQIFPDNSAYYVPNFT